MTSLVYPPDNTGNGPPPKYAHQFDAMGRLSGMQDLPCTVPNGNVCWQYATTGATIATAGYGPAGEIASPTYDGYGETRTYNSLLQLTRISMPNVMDMQYTFSPTQNNGRITQSTDNLSGETVVYSYDSLNRLIRAETTSSAWGDAYSYDGFGNLTNKTPTKGIAPTFVR